MAHRFEIEQDAVVDASPERVWDAIGTGAGWDSWFMGRNEIDPREGGQWRFGIGGITQTSTISTYEPPRRFAAESEPAEDGAFHRFEYTIEPMESGRTQIRYVHSGMLGEDWEREYEGMSEGDPMYFAKLVEYLEHFDGRHAVPVSAFGPNTGDDRDGAMATYRRALGLPDDAAVGDHVALRPDGLDPIDGVIDHLSPNFIGVRTEDGVYRFIRGYEGTMIVGHHLFGGAVDQASAEAAWTDWLARTFGR
jgi:uncharacterized protein YndB with AHSA1/START domain